MSVAIWSPKPRLSALQEQMKDAWAYWSIAVGFATGTGYPKFFAPTIVLEFSIVFDSLDAEAA